MLSLGRPCSCYLSVLVTAGAHILREATKWEIQCRNLGPVCYIATRFLDLSRSRSVSLDNARVRETSVEIESGERWEYPPWPPPANTKRRPNAGLMLGHRRRRWPNIKPALGHFLVLIGHIRPDCVAFPASLQILLLHASGGIMWPIGSPHLPDFTFDFYDTLHSILKNNYLAYSTNYCLTLKALKYCYVNHGTKGFFSIWSHQK